MSKPNRSLRLPSNTSFTRWDALKIIGLMLMFVDHTGAFYYTDEQWLRGVGRACAPIFLFLAGFVPHYKLDKKLLVLALLLTVSDWLVKGAPNTLNILFSILLIRVLFEWMERHERIPLRLHEWFIAAVPFLALLPIVQYGPFGILFGLCGYVYKHRQHYGLHTPLLLLAIATVFYGIIYAWFSEFTFFTTIIMATSLIPMCALLHWFTRTPLKRLPCPAPFAPALKFCARHTAEIYVLHLMILGWMTRIAL